MLTGTKIEDFCLQKQIKLISLIKGDSTQVGNNSNNM
jgi:hypothetical protein